MENSGGLRDLQSVALPIRHDPTREIEAKTEGGRQALGHILLPFAQPVSHYCKQFAECPNPGLQVDSILHREHPPEKVKYPLFLALALHDSTQSCSAEPGRLSAAEVPVASVGNG